MFLGGGTGVFLGEVVGIVDPGPPVDASKKLCVLAPRPVPGQGVFPVGLGIALNVSVSEIIFEVGQICFQFVHYIFE